MTPEGGGAIGQMPHIYDPDKAKEVERLARLGVKKPIIAKRCGISPKVLDKYYDREYETGLYTINDAVAGKAVSLALAGDRAMLRLYLTTIGGWSQQVELTGPGGGPVETIDLSRLSAE